MKKAYNLSRELDFCIKDVKSRVDSRIIAFQVRPEIKEGEIFLRGFVHCPQQETALLDALGKIPGLGGRGIPIHSRLKILSRKKLRFFQVKTPWTDLRLNPKQKADLGTQVLIGSFVLHYFSKGEYCFCSEPTGYLGYVKKKDLIEKTKKDYIRWLNGPRGRILGEVVNGRVFLPPGAELPCADKAHVILPDGKVFRVDKNLLQFRNPSESKKPASLLKHAHSFLRAPYLWGGLSRKGIDCSGFAQLMYLLQNIPLPRDTCQQVGIGRLVGMLGDCSDLLPGDLLFFMGKEGRIIHVGISLGGDRFIHATYKDGIRESRIDDIDYSGGRYREWYILSRRILL